MTVFPRPSVFLLTGFIVATGSIVAPSPSLSAPLDSPALENGFSEPRGKSSSAVTSKTWMTADNLPWSTPVLVRDPEEGDYQAVFDRSFPTGYTLNQIKAVGMGQISNWNRRWIGVYGYGTDQRCVQIVVVPVCRTTHPVAPVGEAALRIGNRIHALQGERGRFPVDESLAHALRTAYPQRVLLRFTLRHGGDTITQAIGSGTVKAWQVIYADAIEPPAEGSPAASPSPLAAGLDDRRVSTGLPVVVGSQWRNRTDLPWSRLVLVRDEFDGDFEAVLDRDYQKNDWSRNEHGLVSNWSRAFIWLHIYLVDAGISYGTIGVPSATIRVGEEVFALPTPRNRIEVTPELAKALHRAGPNSVSVSFPNQQGKSITHRIGNGTIAALRTLYAPAALPTPP